MDRLYRPAESRDEPYIHVTWLTKLITGEASCLWSLWFRARHKFDKLESGFDLQSWTKDHDDLVAWRAKKLRDAGYRPYIEQNFKVNGRTATISGTADLVYESEGTLWIEECKTGKRRDSDHVQALIYTWLAELGHKSVAGAKVVYKSGIDDVDRLRLPEIRESALRLIKIATSIEPPHRAPSINDCKSCHIGHTYCEERMSSGDAEIFVTDAF